MNNKRVVIQLKVLLHLRGYANGMEFLVKRRTED